MSKMILSVLLFSFAFAPFSFAAGTDPKNTKFRIARVSDLEWDCKISRKEISKYDGTSLGTRYICSYLNDDDDEVVLSELAGYVREGFSVFEYAGKDPQSLLDLLNDWRDLMIREMEKGEFSYKKTMADVKPWTFRLVSADADVANVALENAETGDSVTLVVKMNQVQLTENEKKKNKEREDLKK